MKRAILSCSFLAALTLSSGVFATQPVTDVSVDSRLQVISSQLDKTNALLTKLVGETPASVTTEKPRPDPEMIKKLDGYKQATERNKNQCSGFDADPQRYPEGKIIEVKGKKYKCITSPHWQEQ
ncbi:hypothetical protein ACQUXI_003953 [Cronobacter turicensis]|nr:hypothetical protein [Klebsiella pneumoniae]